MPANEHRPGVEHRGDADDLLGSGVGTEGTGTAAVMQLWRQTIATSKRDSLARRARVLAHPDLAQRLTDPPLRLRSPERWSGWIPLRELPQESCGHCTSSGGRRCRGVAHRARANDSPVRRQLVDIAAGGHGARVGGLGATSRGALILPGQGPVFRRALIPALVAGPH